MNDKQNDRKVKISIFKEKVVKKRILSTKVICLWKSSQVCGRWPRTRNKYGKVMSALCITKVWMIINVNIYFHVHTAYYNSFNKNMYRYCTNRNDIILFLHSYTDILKYCICVTKCYKVANCKKELADLLILHLICWIVFIGFFMYIYEYNITKYTFIMSVSVCLYIFSISFFEFSNRVRTTQFVKHRFTWAW